MKQPPWKNIRKQRSERSASFLVGSIRWGDRNKSAPRNVAEGFLLRTTEEKTGKHELVQLLTGGYEAWKSGYGLYRPDL